MRPMGEQLNEQIVYGFILDMVIIIQNQNKGLLNQFQFVEEISCP